MKNKKYDVVVVDPPWDLEKIERRVRPDQKGFDYSTMSMGEIGKLPIKSFMKPDALCFLWTTQKYIARAIDILEVWGLSRLLTMVWRKEYGRSNGMPMFGFRWNAEFVHVGYLNAPEAFKKGKLIKACFCAENKGHSIKPDKFYKELERIGPDRIDLFARQERKGWDVWGDEVQSDIVMTDYFL